MEIFVPQIIEFQSVFFNRYLHFLIDVLIYLT